MRRLTIVSLNQPGEKAAARIREALKDCSSIDLECELWTKRKESTGDAGKDSPGDHSEFPEGIFSGYFDSLEDLLDRKWKESDLILFLAATGIVIRKIAPRLESKLTDPGVLVADFDLQFFIPILSGHVGGANEAALELTSLFPGSRAVLTTGTDQKSLPAFDLFARKSGFHMENPAKLAAVSNALLNGDPVAVFAPGTLLLRFQNEEGLFHPLLHWKDLDQVDSSRTEGTVESVTLSPLPHPASEESLRIRLRPFWVGCGMNRGTGEKDLEYALDRFLREHGLGFQDLAGLASFSEKSNEDGLLKFAKGKELPLVFFTDEEINGLSGEFSESMAGKYFGIKGVAEPCAVLASSNRYLFLRKHIYGDVTLAAAF